MMELLHILHHEDYTPPSFKTYDQYLSFKQKLIEESHDIIGKWETVTLTVTSEDVPSMKEPFTFRFRFRDMAEWLETELKDPTYNGNIILQAKEGTAQVAEVDGCVMPVEVHKAWLKAQEKHTKGGANVRPTKKARATQHENQAPHDTDMPELATHEVRLVTNPQAR